VAQQAFEDGSIEDACPPLRALLSIMAHGSSLVAHAYLEGTYSEFYPNISQDAEGMQKLFKQFSFPGGIPSHVAPETPGSIHEGGELGYALSHAYGAAFDNPDLIVACVVGDGEAETGALATGWHGNKFLNPARDGCVLPILHLNGYKIANPCFLARIPEEELQKYFEGMGYKPYFVVGHEPHLVHQQLSEVLDTCVAEIKQIWADARAKGAEVKRPAWPLIVFRTPKGWTCPPEIDGKKCEDYWRSHQVPMGDMDKVEHIKILEQWMKAYKPEELFDEAGKLKSEIAELAPAGQRRMSDNPHANGGLLLRDLKMPDFRDYAVKVPSPGATITESAREMGKFLRDVMKLNMDAKNFRLFSPDENNSNRWQDVLDVTTRCYMADIYPEDDKLSPDGRVMEVLSEHQCQGWLEAYLLTGRHGFFSCYELLSVTDHCLRSRNYVNVVIAGKQPAPQCLTMDQAIKHCTAGLGIWEFASNDKGGEPDVVMACCGDVPTLETLAAVELIRKHVPELKVRVVNIVDLMTLQPQSEHPHGLSDHDFDALFTKDKPIIFAFHGYPWLIHRLTYRRTNHKNLHVRGYKEEGTTTTPFDMVVMNDLDRFHLCEDVVDRLPQLDAKAAYFKQAIHEKLIEHKEYIEKWGDDMPEIAGWKWGVKEPVKTRGTSTEGDNV